MYNLKLKTYRRKFGGKAFSLSSYMERTWKLSRSSFYNKKSWTHEYQALFLDPLGNWSCRVHCCPKICRNRHNASVTAESYLMRAEVTGVINWWEYLNGNFNKLLKATDPDPTYTLCLITGLPCFPLTCSSLLC